MSNTDPDRNSESPKTALKKLSPAYTVNTWLRIKSEACL